MSSPTYRELESTRVRLSAAPDESRSMRRNHGVLPSRSLMRRKASSP